MDIHSSFRYHLNNDDLFRKFDHSISSKKLLSLKLLYWMALLSGMFLLIRAAVRLYFALRTLREKPGDIIVVSFGKNHRTVYNQLNRYGFDFPVYHFGSVGNQQKGLIEIGGRWVLLATVAFPWKCLKELKLLKGNDFLERNTLRIIKSVGFSFYYKLILKRASVLIKFNDHGCYAVLLHDMAKDAGLKTVYIQHAPVSTRFPPLHHDLNVLFSEDSREKYRIERPDVKTIVLSDLRFDPNLKLPQPNYKHVLVCPNKLDDFDVVVEVCNVLVDKGFQVVLRPHPADKRFAEKVHDKSFTFALSTSDSVWEDIGKAGCVLTNESAVTIEAIYAGRLCYKCAMFSESIDNYGFLEKGLLGKEYYNIDELVRDIERQQCFQDPSKLSIWLGEVDQIGSHIKLLKNEVFNLRS